MSKTNPFLNAQWICPAGAGPNNNSYFHFRRDFTLKQLPHKAPFHITADQSYMLYVNGLFVGRGPARGYQRQWPFDEYNLSPFLTAGKNWISVRVFNGGISTFSYITEWHAGLLCAARWRGFELVSDSSWLSRLSNAVRPNTKRVSTQMNLQEQVDLRLDDQKWIRSPKPPTDWKTKTTTRAFGVMPWHSVEPRNLPNLANRILPYVHTCATAGGSCISGYEDSADVADLLREELPQCKWSGLVTGRKTTDGFTFTIPPSGSGKFTAVTLNLGQNSVGTLLVDASGASGTEILDLFFSEILNDDGSPVLSLSTAARLHLHNGHSTHELFQMMGHHYLTVVLRDADRPVRLKLALRETLYPLDIKGRFDCSDPVLKNIYNICVRTQQICALDSYVDTPWREQAQWWGDARVQARNTFHLIDDPRLLIRGIRCLAQQEVPNGLTYSHAPTNCHGGVIPDFSIIWAVTLWDYYWQTGKTDLFVEQWPRLKRLIDYFEGEGQGKNGLLCFDKRYWLFLDWATIHKEGTPTLLNLWYLLMLEKTAALAGPSGMKAERKYLLSLYRRQKQLVLKTFWDEKAGLFHDGLTPAGKSCGTCSIHTQTLAILCGLKKPAWPAMIQKRLLPYLRGEAIPGAQPSSYWVTYVHEVMTRVGYGADVVRHIRKNFEPMIPYGGTWEKFEFRRGSDSVSHAWSAHPTYHLPGAVGGILQNAAAWKHITFAPALDLLEMNSADTIVPTPQGLIRSSWKRNGKTVNVRLSLPKGVQAEVILPGIPAITITGSHKWTIGS